MKRLAVRRLAPSRPAMLGVLAAVVMAALWFKLMWGPQGAAIASAHQREHTATAALINAEQRLGHLKRLASHAQQLDALAAAFNAAVPSQDQLDIFLVELNTDAQRDGVTLTSIGVAAPASGTGSKSSAAAAIQLPTGITALPLQLSVTGGYFSIQQFLGDLRDGSRLVTVDTLSLSSGAAAPTAGPANGTLVSASISAHIYLASTPSVAANLHAPAVATRSGTGVLETPINAARSTAAAASATAAAHAGGTP